MNQELLPERVVEVSSTLTNVQGRRSDNFIHLDGKKKINKLDPAIVL